MSQEMSGANDAKATKRSLPRGLRGRPMPGRQATVATILSTLALSGVLSVSSPASAQRVTVTIGGYGAQSNGSASSSTAAQPTGNPAGYGQAAWAGAAAYARYMQYVSVLNYQATHGGALPPGLDVHEYFTNGAEALTIPSNSQYFANGSETTVLPGSSPPSQPPSYGPSYAPPANAGLPPTSSLPPPPAAAPPAQSPWVVVMQNPNPQAVPSASPPPSTPPPPSSSASAGPPGATTPPSPGPDTAADTRPPPVAMSFDDWLQSMGYTASDVPQEAPPPELTSAVVATGGEGNDTMVAEPAALAYDVRPRVSLALREKARSRIIPAPSGLGSMGGIAGGFGAGLLLGGLAMLRMRGRLRREPDGSSPPTT